jgi:hypothetical protein
LLFALDLLAVNITGTFTPLRLRGRYRDPYQRIKALGMTLLIAALVVPPAFWAADRLFNRGEFIALIREELKIPAPSRRRAAKRVRISVRR